MIGTIDYTPTPWINLHLGYRSLNFDYTASGGLNLGYNVHMKGPLLAVTFSSDGRSQLGAAAGG